MNTLTAEMTSMSSTFELELKVKAAPMILEAPSSHHFLIDLILDVLGDLQLEAVELAIIPFEGQEITIAEVVNKVQHTKAPIAIESGIEEDNQVTQGEDRMNTEAQVPLSLIWFHKVIVKGVEELLPQHL